MAGFSELKFLREKQKDTKFKYWKKTSGISSSNSSYYTWEISANIKLLTQGRSGSQ